MEVHWEALDHTAAMASATAATVILATAALAIQV